VINILTHNISTTCYNTVTSRITTFLSTTQVAQFAVCYQINTKLIYRVWTQRRDIEY